MYANAPRTRAKHTSTVLHGNCFMTMLLFIYARYESAESKDTTFN